MAGIFPIDVGIWIAVNLILNGRIEFILTPRVSSVTSTVGKDTFSITLVKTGVLLFMTTDAISL